jgi:HAD superfamily hydrolase (TIGR01509 family)
MIKAIIFDCFGVIVTDALEVLAVEARAKDQAVGRELSDTVGLHARGLISQDESNTRISDLLGLTVDEMRQKIIEGEVKDLQLLDYIKSLRNTYKTAMLSNIGASGLQRRFETQELADHFDIVVASGQIGYAKPEAQAYEITAEQLGVRLEECIFTDDREVYCQGARAVGMQAIQYESFGQFKRELEGMLKDE